MRYLLLTKHHILAGYARVIVWCALVWYGVVWCGVVRYYNPSAVALIAGGGTDGHGAPSLFCKPAFVGAGV